MLAVQNSSVRAMMMPRSMNGCGSESTTYPSIVRKSSRKSSTKKSVRFAATVKVHDGLSPHKRVYDEVVHDLFNRPDDRYRTIRDVVNSANVPILELLKAQLDELMRRCSQGKTPVLNCGGGRNNVVDQRFAPWLRKLSNQVVSHIELINDYIEDRGSVKAVQCLELGEDFRI